MWILWNGWFSETCQKPGPVTRCDPQAPTLQTMDDPFTFGTTDDVCVVCGQRVSGDRCYSHIRYNDRMMALCCPLCLETFQKNPEYYDVIREISKSLKSGEKHEGDG